MFLVDCADYKRPLESEERDSLITDETTFNVGIRATDLKPSVRSGHERCLVYIVRQQERAVYVSLKNEMSTLRFSCALCSKGNVPEKASAAWPRTLTPTKVGSGPHHSGLTTQIFGYSTCTTTIQSTFIGYKTDLLDYIIST